MRFCCTVFGPSPPPGVRPACHRQCAADHVPAPLPPFPVCSSSSTTRPSSPASAPPARSPSPPPRPSSTARSSPRRRRAGRGRCPLAARQALQQRQRRGQRAASRLQTWTLMLSWRPSRTCCKTWARSSSSRALGSAPTRQGPAEAVACRSCPPSSPAAVAHLAILPFRMPAIKLLFRCRCAWRGAAACLPCRAAAAPCCSDISYARQRTMPL